MIDLGKHAVFIWASYGVVTFVVLALIIWLWFDGKRHGSRLAELEASGVRRRSQSGASNKGNA